MVDSSAPSLRVVRGGQVIGRSADADLAVEDTAASRLHARFNRQGDDFEIENLSPNGTKVNGKAIEKRLLKDGDVIEIGAATRLRVRYLTQSGTVVSHVDDGAAGGAAAAFDDDAVTPVPRGKAPRASLLRRPKVIVGLAVYLVGMLALFLVLETSRTQVSPPRVLGRDEIAAMMERYFAADSAAFRLTANAKKEQAALDRAREAFNTAPVSAQSLWRAAQGFREAQGYSADRAWRDPDDARRFRQARSQLADRLCAEYIDAIAEQRKGRLKEARERFYRLQQIVPDRGCELNQHVGRWVTAINARLD